MKKPRQLAIGLAVLLLPAISLLGCDSGDATETELTATLSGIVRESGTESPIADATVMAGGTSSTTAEDGRFELQNVGIGPSVSVQAEAEGFDSYAQSIAIEEGPNTHNIVLDRTTIYTSGELVAYLPPSVTNYRGAIFILPGSESDSRPLVRGVGDPLALELRDRSVELAELYGLALVGTNSMPQIQGTYAGMLAALEQFADRSGHPELAQAPLLLAGFSMGGCLAHSFTRQFSDRVIGFITMKGGCHDLVTNASARAVPAYLFIGELDLLSRAINITELFEQNRAEGALWALATEPDTQHAPVADNGLLFTWMDAVLSRRLPETVTPGTPVTLRPVDEDSGWLGNRTSLDIAEYACFDDDPLSASWLPDEQTARDWQALVSSGEVTTVSSCDDAR